MDDQGNFSAWLIRGAGREPERIASDVSEPAEAADYAEEFLSSIGRPGESYAEIRYNGDAVPHTTICLLEKEGRGWVVFGVHNSEHARWPIHYQEGDLHGIPLDDLPGQVLSEQAERMRRAEESEKKARSEDEGNMQIGDDDEDKPDEEEIEDDGDAQEDEAQEDENEEDAFDGDDENESEEDSGEDAEDDQGDVPDERDGDDDQNSSDDEDNGEDSDDDGEGDSDDEDDEEEEVEMPRLGIFAKFRGPLGWRKRAEAEELETTNKFVLKLGVLDPEAEKTAQQEREVFAEIQFVESDEDRASGLLRLKLPEGIEFTQKGKWLQASIPYRQQEA